MTVQEGALGCLGVLELERLWPARSCDVGTSRAPVVVRILVRAGEGVPLSLAVLACRRLDFLVSYRTLAAALGLKPKNERITLRFWRRITYCELINATRPAAAVQVQQRLTSRSAAECSIIAYPQ